VIFHVEVADSSLPFDQRTKIPLYARAGIPEAWRVNLVAEDIEVHRRPSSGGYQEIETLRRSERLAPVAFSECRLTVDEILGGP
jgi:Uma2 family endonuclease